MQTIQEFFQKLSRSITLKVVIIGIMILVLLIPSMMIRNLISERQANRNSVVAEVSDKWGREQTVTGPVIAIPYYLTDVKDDEQKTYYRTLYVLPDKLDVNGKINPEIRKRNIYKVIVYQSDIAIDANFHLPDISRLDIPPDQINWDKAVVLFGLGDLRGIQKEIHISVNGKKYSVESGLKYQGLAGAGFSSNIRLDPEAAQYDFHLDLNLSGSENIFFTPVGKTTRVKLVSSWPSPSFDGNFLPDTRKVSDDGFEAEWTILDLNRNFPQVWNNQVYPVESAAFGVNLLFPVNEYQKSMRSAKYAIMFITLTFLVFLFVEIITKNRIHPVQYLLVSIALLLFYTLLLSLSEQIGFNRAYLVSAVAIIGMISAYTYSMFKSRRPTLITSGFLTLLYAFLFSILQLEDFALLFGSIGLFIILGVVMYFSRKIDWYGQINAEKPPIEK